MAAPLVLRHALSPGASVSRLSVLFPQVPLPPVADRVLVAVPWGVKIAHISNDAPERLSTLTEIVDRAVLTVVKRHGEDGNVLGLGYRLTRGVGALKSGTELECRVPNWVVSQLKESEWGIILDAVGDRILLDLLVRCSLFLQHDNGSIAQLTGPPLQKTLTSVGRDLLRAKEPKRLRRERVFYSSRIYRNGGLPASHLLNRLVAGTHMVPKEQWALVSHTQARKLALHISQGSIDARRLDMAWSPAIGPLRVLLERQRRLPYLRLFAEHCNVKDEPHGQIAPRHVAGFVKAVVRRLVPKTLLGSKHSRRRIFENVSKLVNLPRSDKLAVDVMMRGIKIRDFAWLKVKAGAPSSHQRRLISMAQRWLEFLFNDVVCEVIRAHFYVTEGEPGGILYFAKHDWQRLANREHRRLRSHLFSPASPAEVQALKKRKSGLARLRLVPKTDGTARLLMNLGGISKGGFSTSVNQASRPAFHALKYEMTKNLSMVQDLDDIHARLVEYAQRRDKLGGLRDLYVVALDLRRCFDTIRHDRLLPLVHDVLRESEYSVTSHSLNFVDRAMKRARTRTVWNVRPASEAFRPIPSTSARRAVRTDHVNRWFVSRQRASDIVEEVVTRNFAETPFGLSRQIVGVPQGSVLSNLLCNLYYGCFDAKVCHGVVDSGEDVLMRLVDDYCFLTPSPARASDFVAIMHGDHTEWGAQVNRDKTRTSMASADGWVPWCGILLHGATGRVRVSYGKTLSAHAPVDTCTGGLERAMRASLAVKLHAVFVDPLLQTPTECAINIAQMLVVCARRMHAWACRARHPNAGVQAMHSLFGYALALARARCATATRGARAFALPPPLVRALGGLAFLETLRHRPGLHRAVVEDARDLARSGPKWAALVGADWSAVQNQVQSLLQSIE